MLAKYITPWYGLLSQLQGVGGTATFVAASGQAGVVFPKNAARQKFFETYPCFASLLEDYLPSAEVLLALAQRNLEQSVSATNVEIVRAEVERLARQKTYKKRQLILEGISYRFSSGTPLSDSQVVAAIIADYEPAIAAINNAGVTLAGRVHELILMDALEAIGLIRGHDFEKPKNPTKNGDIRGKAKPSNDYLGTEVKSLKARERFARGLGEIGGNKVGAGFFDDSTEFTPSLTSALIGISTRAVYLPPLTLKDMPSHVQGHLNADQRSFYRPITQYAPDMAKFVKTGQLP